MERVQNLCRCAEVNGAKTKSLRCRRVKWLINDKRAGIRKHTLLGSKFVSMGVLSDDFATVDLREELCYHSRPKEAKFRGTRDGKNQRKKAMRGGKSGSRSGAVQRGRLRSAATSAKPPTCSRQAHARIPLPKLFPNFTQTLYIIKKVARYGERKGGITIPNGLHKKGNGCQWTEANIPELQSL